MDDACRRIFTTFSLVKRTHPGVAAVIRRGDPLVKTKNESERVRERKRKSRSLMITRTVGLFWVGRPPFISRTQGRWKKWRPPNKASAPMTGADRVRFTGPQSASRPPAHHQHRPGEAVNRDALEPKLHQSRRCWMLARRNATASAPLNTKSVGKKVRGRRPAARPAGEPE